MKRHLRWRQLITQFHRWIHGCSDQTWGTLMLERHYYIGRHAHMVKTENAQTAKQTGDVRGWPAREDETPSHLGGVKISGLSQAFRMLPVNSFTANHAGLECVLLQFTSAVSDFPEGLSPDSPTNSAVQCNSGLYKPEFATVRKLLECKLSLVPASVHVHHSTADCSLLHIWDFVRNIREWKETLTWSGL